MRAGCIAQDVIVSPASQTRARWYIHGAAQTRRGTVLAVSHILGAPSFSPHRSRAFTRRFAHSPIRPIAVSPFRRCAVSLIRPLASWLLPPDKAPPKKPPRGTLLIRPGEPVDCADPCPVSAVRPGTESHTLVSNPARYEPSH